MERKEKALLNHKSGYNCAQSTACSFADKFGFDEKAVFRMAEGFGLGMGCKETCGAVTAMAMVTGMKVSDGNLSAPGTKKTCYEIVPALIEEFREKHGSIMCSDLKDVETAGPLSCCDGYIMDAVAILEKNL